MTTEHPLRSKYDPHLTLPDHDGTKRVRVDQERRSHDRITRAIEVNQNVFGTGYRPVVVWGRMGLTLGGKAKTIHLVKRQASGKIALHPILGHPKVPDDIFNAAVLLGMLMALFAERQKDPKADLFAYPKAVDWLEAQMDLSSSSEFLARLIQRFSIWVIRL